MQFARFVSLREAAGAADQLLQAVNQIPNRILFPFQQLGLTFADPPLCKRHLWLHPFDSAAPEHSADHRN